MRGPLVERQRVKETAAGADLIVQVRAGRASGRSNHRNRLTLFYALAIMDEDFAGMAVERFVSVTMINDDVQAVSTAVIGGVGDDPVSRGINR